MENANVSCDMFTILEWRPNDRLLRCDVCDQAEESHPQPGRRRVSGGEMEELRKRLLMTVFERQEEASRRKEGNGEPSAPATQI